MKNNLIQNCIGSHVRKYREIHVSLKHPLLVGLAPLQRYTGMYSKVLSAIQHFCLRHFMSGEQQQRGGGNW